MNVCHFIERKPTSEEQAAKTLYSSANQKTDLRTITGVYTVAMRIANCDPQPTVNHNDSRVRSLIFEL
jgi:hypothetical protein